VRLGGCKWGYSLTEAAAFVLERGAPGWRGVEGARVGFLAKCLQCVCWSVVSERLD